MPCRLKPFRLAPGFRADDSFMKMPRGASWNAYCFWLAQHYGTKIAANQHARRRAMPSKKKSLPTPLHLLQELSGGLVAHLENACAKALAEAESILGKLEKERSKAQEKLHKNRVKLQDAAAAGKAKAQARARKSISEMEAVLDSLKDRQAQTLQYITELKRDAQESLNLAQGVNKVRDAVGKSLSQRAAKVAAPKTAAKAPAAKAPAARAAVAKASAKPAATPAAKPAAKAPVRKPAAKPAATKPAAKPAAKPAVARKPAVRRPAATKPAAAPADKPAV